MRLKRIHVENYRSVKDTGWFDVEPMKTILVGPNEAGKTAVLRALEHISPGPLVEPLDPLRDYPRSEHYKIQSGQLTPDKVRVATAEFLLEDDDEAAVAEVDQAFANCEYWRAARLDNTSVAGLVDAPATPRFDAVKDDLRRLALHADSRVPAPAEGQPATTKPGEILSVTINGWQDNSVLNQERGAMLLGWLDSAAPYVDEANESEMNRLAALRSAVATGPKTSQVVGLLSARVPRLVYFSTYTRVTPMIHLGHLADMIDAGAMSKDDEYQFGNLCLLKLLGFTARELSDLGRAEDPAPGDTEAFQRYRNQLDRRDVALNSASLQLTREIQSVWEPGSGDSAGDYKIRIKADQQYLKVVVEDWFGVEVELDQRSHGFQWLVSFFVVFFAQAQADLKGAILLLDEPGLSLHGLKQREFRKTLSRLAESNQLIFTTHSPFLVGPDELDVVRVVEMTNRDAGTKVHTDIVADDPASLLPLQEALGYDIAQSLFAQQRNLILEGLTDYWYVEATAALLRESDDANLDERIALVPASNAGKVVYFATILHAHHLKVAALLDSDTAGDQAAHQETLIHTLGNKRILRTKDAYSGSVSKPEVEDLLRETLIAVAQDDLGWDVASVAKSQPNRPIADIFADRVSGFSKYKLAKAYLRWTREHAASDLTADERRDFGALIGQINKATK
jgi:hypothetical protein